MRRLVDEAQESRHKMLLQVVVEGGVHLSSEVRQQKRVVAQLELIFVREKLLGFVDVESIEFSLHRLVLRLPTAIVALAHGLQAVEDELLIEYRPRVVVCVLCQAKEPDELVRLDNDGVAVQHECLDLWNERFVPHNRLE